MAGNFNSGYNNEIIKIGAPWWYLDQYHGIKEQINAISAFGILSNFIGMVTDSRSFFSFSRHEYFRRILCQVIADDVENGLIPYDKDLLIELVEGISYKNAKKFLSF
jgi:glucuronate isomerase